MLETIDLLPYRLIMIDNRTNAILGFERASEIASHFMLTKPLTRDKIVEIVETATKGIVHADIDPFMEDVWAERELIVASGASELDRILDERADEI